MVDLTSLEALDARHRQRFADMDRKFKSESIRASQDLQKDLIRLHTASLTGSARKMAERLAGNPFAAKWGSAQWQTPPIGSISGALLNSLQTGISILKADQYTITGSSVGVPYAKYVYSPTGTSKMVPRHIPEQVLLFAVDRMSQLGSDLMAYQLRLI